MDRDVVAEHQRKAQMDFFTSVVVPLLGEPNPGDTPSEDPTLKVFGTGTLFQIGRRHFIVTAAHLLKTEEGLRRDIENIMVPTNRKFGKMIRLGKAASHFPAPDFDTDVAVIEVDNRAVVDTLIGSWRFLGPQNVIDERENFDFIVTGYPCDGGKIWGLRVGQNFHSLSTGELIKSPAIRNPDPAYDRFFGLSENSVMPSGEIVKVPRFHGMSGSPIWARIGEEGSCWSPDAVLKLVAVQVSVQASASPKWFRGADWKAVTAILDRIL